MAPPMWQYFSCSGHACSTPRCSTCGKIKNPSLRHKKSNESLSTTWVQGSERLLFRKSSLKYTEIIKIRCRRGRDTFASGTASSGRQLGMRTTSGAGSSSSSGSGRFDGRAIPEFFWTVCHQEKTAAIEHLINSRASQLHAAVVLIFPHTLLVLPMMWHSFFCYSPKILHVPRRQQVKKDTYWQRNQRSTCS
jgi:hypothetical protein